MTETSEFKTVAQEMIHYLTANLGLSKADIAKALGRDRSLISQAARGIKPIENALPALSQLIADREQGRQLTQPLEVERRTTKRGGLANVRGGLVFEKEGGSHVQTKHESFLMKQFQQAAEKQQWLQVAVKYDKVRWKQGNVLERHVAINLYKKGYSAEALLARVDRLLEAEQAAGRTAATREGILKDLLRGDTFTATQRKGGSPGLSSAGSVEQYEIEISDTAPWHAITTG